MADEKILKDEQLNDEQLEQVAGGTKGEMRIDAIFFHQLGYNMARTSIEDAYADNGVRCTPLRDFDSVYKILKPDGWTKHPHWAAMGYVLAQRKYPGFDGKWWDANSVQSFLREHFHISDFG